MNIKCLHKLEYFKILNILSTYCTTSLSKSSCLELLPTSNSNDVARLLNQTDEALNIIIKYDEPPISDFKDISSEIQLLNNNSSTNCEGLLKIANILKISRELVDFWSLDNLDSSKYEELNRFFSNTYTNENIEKEIYSKILSDHTIDDNASIALYSIRTKQRKLEQDIKDKLNSILHSSSYSKYIMENIITIRNGRFVIPFKEEHKSVIKGFIHDYSSSGATAFIEPIAVFELNNNINSLKIEEAKEIEKILYNLSSKLFPIISNIENNIRIISIIDIIFAKAKYALTIDATKPILNTNKSFNLIKAKHPLIDKNIAVPIDINLGNEFSSLIITGPNTGGKTVTLKTVGLLHLMAYTGIFIPVKEDSSIYVFDNIFADIGDEQSIQESLSTFSSHITNIIDILNKSTSNSLILLDELGSGTDPEQGSALALSILEHFFTQKTLCISTTHYNELKNYALTHTGFINASVDFDITKLAPTYKLLLGIPGKSNAFEISEKLGLSKDILQKAKTFINTNSTNIEDLLKSIYSSKEAIELEKEEILKKSNEIDLLTKSLKKEKETLDSQKEKVLDEAKLEARQILESAKDEASNIIKELSNSGTSLKEANNLRNSINNSIKALSPIYVNANDNKTSIDINDIKTGNTVYITNIKQYGIINSSINKSNQVQVLIGSTKINVDIKNLSLIDSSQTKKETNKSSLSNKKTSNLNLKEIHTEINVIGNNVEEAIFVIDKYLDNCYLSGLSSVRIIHGKGTGILKNGIHNFLKKHPHVKNFRLGTFGEGETGATVVELKK